jgi:hypothetical protein
MWANGKILIEKKVFNDFDEFYDAFEIYFRKFDCPKDLGSMDRGGVDFLLLQGLPVWVMEMYAPGDDWVGRALIVQIDEWYCYLWLSWDETYKNLCPGTYAIWSLLKEFVIGKNANYFASEVGLVSQEGNICLDGYQVIVLDEAYLYKAKFGVAPVPSIYIDKNNT